ncbi:unnamed protein product [Polarella glacialis]|uniref:Uncharacterized protein n=1 Tax=Polarella glacialis TaxID=89957 RepID=A0A813EQ58_POLGL|nr:unnamed protein product [Polarella glacialis]
MEGETFAAGAWTCDTRHENNDNKAANKHKAHQQTKAPHKEDTRPQSTIHKAMLGDSSPPLLLGSRTVYPSCFQGHLAACNLQCKFENLLAGQIRTHPLSSH